MIRELFLEDLSLWSCVWQSTVLAGIGLVGSFLLRRRPARAFQVLFLAMIAAVAVPALSVLVKHFELGAFVAEPIALRPEARGMPLAMPFEAPGVLPEPQANAEGRLDAVSAKGSSASNRIPWRAILLLGWMTATLALFGRLLVAFMNGVRLIRQSRPEVQEHIQQASDRARVRLGIARSLQIRASDEIRSPMIWCWSRTAVLLVPRGLNNNVDWVGVICHELAHCMRRDHISGLIAELTACILCWNPLSWLTKKRLVRLGEQACDDWVVAGGQPVENYARSLLNFKPQKQAAFAPAVVHSRKGVAARVRRILKDTCINPRAGARWALAVSLMTGCLAAGVAFAQTRPAKPPTATNESQKKPTESLHRAAAEGDIEQVRSLISKGADANARDQNDATPLHEAAWQGDKDIVKLLIEKGANVNAIQGRGSWTPLHCASDQGHVDVAKILIANGARVDVGSWTALYEAVTHGRIEVAELLIANGADVNFMPKNDPPPLHYAIWRENTEMAKSLVNHGADFNLKDYDGWTAFRYAVDYANRELVDLLIGKGAKVSEFHFAAWRGDLARVRRFLEQGTDVNIKDAQLNWTPLHWATFTAQRDIAEFLIAKGAEVNAGGEWNDTPLHYAAVHGHTELAGLLLGKGAEVNAKDSSGKTPLHEAAKSGHRELTELLLTAGADVDAKYPDGRTALHRAAQKGDKEVVGLLAAKGADINAKNKDGQTPLHFAANRGHTEVVRLLVAKGADLNASAPGWEITALHGAAGRGHIEVVELLIDSGADIDAGDNRWEHTALLNAAVGGQKEGVELLLKKGANIEAKSGDGATSLSATAAYSNHRDYMDVVKLLLDKGADTETRSNVDCTALCGVIAVGRKEAAELLLAHGANLNVISRYFGTPVHLAMRENQNEMVRWAISQGVKIPPLHQAAYFGEIDKVRSLIEKKADVNQEDIARFTPLHCAVMGRSKEAAQLLIESGADVKTRNCGDATPLFTVCNKGYLDMVQLLVENGAEVNSRNLRGLQWGRGLVNNWTSLHIAALGGHIDVVEYLVSKGADIQARCTWVGSGLTALHLAAQGDKEGHTKVIEYLLSKGLDVNLKDEEGRTALDHAKQKNRTEIVELLRQHGAKE